MHDADPLLFILFFFIIKDYMHKILRMYHVAPNYYYYYHFSNHSKS